jgi:hypothetical protein
MDLSRFQNPPEFPSAKKPARARAEPVPVPTPVPDDQAIKIAKAKAKVACEIYEKRKAR